MVGDAAEVRGHNLPYVLPLMQQTCALAVTLAGTPTAVVYPAMPVIVKTPACPTMVCPSPANAPGSWVIEINAEACSARFLGNDG